MGRIKSENHLSEEPLPADCFDLIGGTGTGGIIAILLGRLRLSVSAAIAVFVEISQKVVPDKSWKVWKMQSETSRGTNLESIIKEAVRKILGEGRENARMLDDDNNRCRT